MAEYIPLGKAIGEVLQRDTSTQTDEEKQQGLAHLAAAAQAAGLPAIDYNTPEFKAKLGAVIAQFGEGKDLDALKAEWAGKTEEERQAQLVALLTAFKTQI